jgi:hypothetical protein
MPPERVASSRTRLTINSSRRCRASKRSDFARFLGPRNALASAGLGQMHAGANPTRDDDAECRPTVLLIDGGSAVSAPSRPTARC